VGYKFIILEPINSGTLYLRDKECELSLLFFETKKGLRAKKKSLGNVGICFHCNSPFYMLIASWTGYYPILVSVVYLLGGPVGLTPSASIMCRFACCTLPERNGKGAHACRADVARGDSFLIVLLNFIAF